MNRIDITLVDTGDKGYYVASSEAVNLSGVYPRLSHLSKYSTKYDTFYIEEDVDGKRFVEGLKSNPEVDLYITFAFSEIPDNLVEVDTTKPLSVNTKPNP